jgi:hypothetical protein
VLWATVATGVGLSTHGIEGFARRVSGEMRIYGSSDRRVPALWNMVDTRGGTCGVVGYWNSWPAEAVRGYVVSDQFALTLYQRNFGSGDVQGVVHPPELADELAALVVSPAELSRERLERLGAFTEAERQVIRAAAEATDGPVVGNALAALGYGLAAQDSVASAAVHLLRTRPQPDLLLVFLELPDRAGHGFWSAYEPEAVEGGPDRVDAAWRERWADVVPASYELVDEAIGQLLSELDEDTTILVVSDHGMQSNGQPGGSPADLDRIGRSGRHHPDGILIAAGPAIRPGATAEADLFDVAPTVLAALGLPGSKQCLREPLTALLDPGFLESHPLSEPIPEPALRAGPAPRGTELDAQRLQQLRATGYLGGEDEPR